MISEKKVTKKVPRKPQHAIHMVDAVGSCSCDRDSDSLRDWEITDDFDSVTCPDCLAKGNPAESCPACSGAGTYKGRTCTGCDGTGKLEETMKIRLGDLKKVIREEVARSTSKSKKTLTEAITAFTDEEKAQWSRGNFGFISEVGADFGGEAEMMDAEDDAANAALDAELEAEIAAEEPECQCSYCGRGVEDGQDMCRFCSRMGMGGAP